MTVENFAGGAQLSISEARMVRNMLDKYRIMEFWPPDIPFELGVLRPRRRYQDIPIHAIEPYNDILPPDTTHYSEPTPLTRPFEVNPRFADWHRNNIPMMRALPASVTAAYNLPYNLALRFIGGRSAYGHMLFLSNRGVPGATRGVAPSVMLRHLFRAIILVDEFHVINLVHEEGESKIVSHRPCYCSLTYLCQLHGRRSPPPSWTFTAMLPVECSATST